MTAAAKRSNAPTDLDLQISDRVRSLRTQRGLRQRDVAAHLGIVHQQYHKYESGLNRISAGMLVRLAEILDCKTSDLFPPQLRGIENLDNPVKMDLIRQELIELILDCPSENRLIAIRTLLVD